MGRWGCRKDSKRVLDLFFFVFFVVILRQLVPILGLLFFFVVLIIGQRVDFDRMGLNDFHFGFALGAGRNLAFLDFVFVHVNFGGAFRAPDHGETSLRIGCGPYSTPSLGPRVLG